MSHPRQDSVARRLTRESLKDLDRLKSRHEARIMDMWRHSRRGLMADVVAAYSWATPSGARKWDVGTLHASGAWHALQMRVGATVENLKINVGRELGVAFRDIRHQGRLRGLWILAQIVPENKAPTPRIQPRMREAMKPLASGWADRWDAWTSAYRNTLLQNLHLNAINEGSMADAVNEVDATRIDTPQFTLEAKLARLYDYFATDEAVGGMHQSYDENPDLADVEIWRTRGDLRVCDDCDANEGLTVDEADGDIPLHPNCHCFLQVVPASYAELLRSGDEADRDLAAQMDYEGLVPNSMVIRTDDGRIAGKTVVDFEDWMAGEGQAVTGGLAI